MCSGYVAEMRQKNSTIGNPFNKITDTTWQHLRPTPVTSHFRSWDRANGVREISISNILTNQPDLKENSRTLIGDKITLVICSSDPNKDSSFGHTFTKGRCTLAF